jgi:putative protease
LVRLIRRVAPTLPIHASTQMTLTEPRGIELVRRLGVERVVLARELSLHDIRQITAKTDMPVEVFVHGALCVAYSGQCLTSEVLGGRSANRGQCAQACRLPYELIVDGRVQDLGDRAYLLSPQDLAAYDYVQPLIEAGVLSFKIEGRLKGGPYVAATTQTYRNAIDAALSQQRYRPERQDILDMAQTFSRGLTPGFLEGPNHQLLVQGRFPKSRGVRVGQVREVRNHHVIVRLIEDVPNLVKPGDGVVFDIGKPEEIEPGGRVWSIRQLASSEPHQGHDIELTFDPLLSLANVLVGCTVWKTDDPALRKRLIASYSQDKRPHRIPVAATVSGTLGGPLTLTLRTSTESATATWTGPLAAARNRPTSPEDIRGQLARLGETPFELHDLTTELPEHILIPRSVLNDLRRQATTELTHRLTRRSHAVSPGDELAALRAESVAAVTSDGNVCDEARLTVLVRTLDQLEAVLAWSPPDGLPRPAAIYCDFEDIRRYSEAVRQARLAGIPVGLATLRILKPGEEGFQSPIVRANPDLVLIRNLGSVSFFHRHLPAAKLIGDFSLNVANELTADWLAQEGLVRVVPSYDLNWDQLRAMLRRYHPGFFEPVIHQHMPMFHMEHCVFAAFLSTGKDHRDCGRPCDRHRIELRDRVGAEFPVHPDTGCRNTVYNGIPQSAAEYIGRMRECGIQWFRVDLLREPAPDINRLLNSYARLLAGRDDGGHLWRELRAMSQLGVTRGTLNLA